MMSSPDVTRRDLMEGGNNRQAQNEEKLALTSIYTEDFLKEVQTGRKDEIAYLVRFSVELDDGLHLPMTTVVFTIHLTPTYPKGEPPVYEIKEAYGEPAWITDDHRAILKSELQEMFDATTVTFGEHGVVLFEWIEWLRDWLRSSWLMYLDQHPEFISRHQMEEKRILSEELASISMPQSARLDGSGEGSELLNAEEEIRLKSLSNLPPVYHSTEPLVDRKSVFVAHIAPVTSVEEVERVKQYLLSNSKIARATHNISAYRIVQQRSAAGKGKHAIDGEVTLSNCDDDGENAAGGRLLHLLEVCKCRNVMVVVSRWYGGTLLGPDRFKHINNVARDLLNAHGFIP